MLRMLTGDTHGRASLRARKRKMIANQRETCSKSFSLVENLLDVELKTDRSWRRARGPKVVTSGREIIEAGRKVEEYPEG